MNKRSNPKCKKCRREGVKLFLKGDRCNSPKCAMVRRNFPPGAHGVKGYGRLTDYGVQMREKQKAKKIYGILETQFKNYFIKATKIKGNTKETLLQLLEMRLDNVLYRSNIFNSRGKCKQLISHGKILVDGKKVDICSYQVNIGNVISFKNTDKEELNNLKEKLKKVESLSWLAIDPEKASIKVTDKPKFEDVKVEFDPQLIVEFYSR